MSVLMVLGAALLHYSFDECRCLHWLLQWLVRRRAYGGHGVSLLIQPDHSLTNLLQLACAFRQMTPCLRAVQR